MTVITRRTMARVCGLGLLSAWSTPATARPQDRPTHGAAIVGTRHHRGITARDALPASLHLQNVGGSDGLGLCVFTSIGHSARYQGIEELADLRDWMRRHPGGGWPEKVDRVLDVKLGPDHGIEYLHVQGADAYPLLERAACEGLMPCVSLGYSERYPELGYAIDHMVNLAHLDDRYACVFDNNFIGDDRYEWMSRAEFEIRSRWSSSGPSEVWGIIFFAGLPQPPEPEVGPLP